MAKTAIPNTTLNVATNAAQADPWVKKVKYEQVRDGKVVYTVESVGAFQTQGGAWVLNHGDIRVTMSKSGDRITTPDGIVLVITKYTSLRNGARRMIETVPLNPQPPKPKK